MKKLIEVLENQENQHKIALLSLNPAFMEMKTKHEDFEALFAY